MTGTLTRWSGQHRSDFDWQEEGDSPMVTIPLDSYNALTSKYGTEGVTYRKERV